MADLETKTFLSVRATKSGKLKDLPIKDGQLIFVYDTCRIAFDLEGKRSFYNQITELASEAERQSLDAPITGQYYFVVDTAVLWTFNGGWKQLTSTTEDTVYIGTDELPELGKATTLYVSKAKRNISVWDEDTNSYLVVGEAYDAISNADIDLLFAN